MSERKKNSEKVTGKVILFLPKEHNGQNTNFLKIIIIFKNSFLFFKIHFIQSAIFSGVLWKRRTCQLKKKKRFKVYFHFDVVFNQALSTKH